MASQIRIALTFTELGSGQDAAAVGDRLTEEMHALEGTEGHDSCSVGYSVISSDRLEVDLDLEIGRDDQDELQAAADGLCWIRTALHAAGVGTAGWPKIEGLTLDGVRTLAEV